MIPDQNILTYLLKAFQGVLSLGAHNIMPYAKKTLILLMIIDLVLKAIRVLIYNNSQNEFKINQSTVIIENAIMYGFFVYLVFGVTNTSGYAEIVNIIQKGFITVGLEASQSSLNINDFTNPSKISTRGMDIAWNLIESPLYDDESTTLTSKIIIYLCGISIILAFFLIGIRIFVLQISFAVIAAAGIILIPFGVWEPTKFIFEKIKNTIIEYGLKFMFMSFVIGIVYNITNDWGKIEASATYNQAIYLLIGTLALLLVTNMADRMSSFSGASSAAGALQSGKHLAGDISRKAYQIKEPIHNLKKMIKKG